MKKMNVAKGLVAGLFSVMMVSATAQTDTTLKKTDSSGLGATPDSMKAAMPRQDYTITELSTNTPIEIYYDTLKFQTVNRISNAPVEFYILNNTDTIHGATGLVVNGLLLKAKDGTYKLDDAKVKIDGDEMKIKYADGRKVKWENGKVKVKEWGTKAKAKGDKEKLKNQWGRVRWKNGEWTVDKDS
jgi:hypothetical protein